MKSSVFKVGQVWVIAKPREWLYSSVKIQDLKINSNGEVLFKSEKYDWYDCTMLLDYYIKDEEASK